jgi:hypothetical protein
MDECGSLAEKQLEIIIKEYLILNEAKNKASSECGWCNTNSFCIKGKRWQLKYC